MLEFPFIGGTEGDDIAFSAQRTVNLYPETNQRYKNNPVLIGFPGDEFYAGPQTGESRGQIVFKDHMIYVSGPQVHKVRKGGSTTAIGSLNTDSGLVSMAENGLECVIVDGRDGFVWDGSQFNQITDSTFTQLNSDSVTYLDSAFIVNRPGTGQIYASDALDAKTWNASKTATAEYASDPVIVVWQDRELLLGGTQTVQMYYNSGASPMPFEPIRQGRIIYGIASKDSVRVVDNTTYALFADERGSVFVGRLNGYTVERVSTRSLERFFSGIDYEDSFALAIHYRGHEFYIITFPVADTGRGRTFGFDIASKMWFEIGKWHSPSGDFEKYHALTHTFFDGEHIIGDADGNLRKLTENYLFQGEEIVSLRRCPVLHDKRERVFYNKLQLDVEVGQGTNSGQGSDPKLRLEISDDGGRTFKNFREKSLGEKGEYEQRVQFHHLGSSYDRVFQASISDPVPRKFLAGYVQ